MILIIIIIIIVAVVALSWRALMAIENKIALHTHADVEFHDDDKHDENNNKFVFVISLSVS